jgi:hypothetical protein
MRNKLIKTWLLAFAVLTALPSCGEEAHAEHNYEEYTVISEPNCNEKGVKIRRCKTCSYLDISLEDALGHDYATSTIEPTCAQGGYDLHVCSRCHDSYKDNETDATEHSFLDWVTIMKEEKTCHGLQYRQCATCRELEFRYLHNYELTSVTTESTAEANQGVYTCSVCDESKTDTVTYASLGMPILSLNGSMDGISKENKITIAYRYEGDNVYEGTATLKWQGGSSINYPKKNFNINFLKENGKKDKLLINEAWGKQSKYTLKANYVDYSASRNVVSASIYGQVVKSRTMEDEYATLVNGGAIDGFPILMFVNGSYQGLYTLNIPKDEWLFGMDEQTQKQAILMGDNWSDAVKLKETITADDYKGLALEYCSTEDESWVVESWNNFVNFLNNSTDEEFKEGIGNYTTIERAIDSHIFTTVIGGADNTAKNILWTTYDGVKWCPSVYDMDGTWGLSWSGKDYYSSSSINLYNTANKLHSRLLSLYYSDYLDRYKELRKGPLSQENIEKQFSSFFAKIPSFIYESESDKWPDVPSRDTNNFSQIKTWAEGHLEYLDGLYA